MINNQLLREVHGLQCLQCPVKSSDIVGNMGIRIDADLNSQLCAALGDPDAVLLMVSGPHEAVFIDLDSLVELFYPLQDCIHIEGDTCAADMAYEINLGVLQCLEIHLCGLGDSCTFRKALGVDAGDDEVHLFEDQLLQCGLALIGISDYRLRADDVVTEQVTLKVHHICFAATKKGDLVPLSGPLIHAEEVLIILDVFVVGIQHVAEMVCAGKELESRLLGRLDILLYG